MRNKYFLLFASICVALLIAEMALRGIFHITPGIISYGSSFKQVDSLTNLKGFYSDSDGIFKVDPESGLVVQSLLAQKLAGRTVSKPFDPNKELSEIYTLYSDFAQVRSTEFQNDFSAMLRRIESTKELSLVDSLIVNYSHRPVNSEGFRSIEFIPVRSSKKRVLLLGDSFTWGHTAANKTNSFADILLTKGYVVYNTGISGADPAQYLAIAKKYIPLLKPDIVVVNFFLGNDVMNWPRQILPYQPIFYSVNAGALYACPQGVYLGNAESTYQFNLDHCRIPVETNLFNNFCSKTAIGTAVWIAANHFKFRFAKLQFSKYKSYEEEVSKLYREKPYSDELVDSIRILSEKEAGKFLLIAIPDIYKNKLRQVPEIPHLFDGLDYFTSPVPITGYRKADGHFNESGHRQYAIFLDSLFRTVSN